MDVLLLKLYIYYQLVNFIFKPVLKSISFYSWSEFSARVSERSRPRRLNLSSVDMNEYWVLFSDRHRETITEIGSHRYHGPKPHTLLFEANQY